MTIYSVLDSHKYYEGKKKVEQDKENQECRRKGWVAI